MRFRVVLLHDTLIFSLILTAFGNPCFSDSRGDAAACVISNGQTDLVKWVESVSGNLPQSDQCEVVEVLSARTIAGMKFNTSGQGATFRSVGEPGKTFILTASHVVSGAESVELRCGEKVYRAKVRGSSPTRDLAVLEVEGEPAKDLRALFVWDRQALPIPEILHKLQVSDRDFLHKGSYFLQTSSDAVNPEALRVAKLTKDGLRLVPNRVPVQVEVIPNPAEHPLVGSVNALSLKRQGVRPGMSGSPIIYSVIDPIQRKSEGAQPEQHFLAGILVKTFVNETEAVAIPIETINETLPSLMKGVDPARSSDSPFYYEKKVSFGSEGLIETPEITFRTEHGEEKIQAVCPGPFSNSSSGLKITANVGKGGSGDSGKGGSGDSGSSRKAPRESKSLAKDGFYNSSIYSLYRDHLGCKEYGLRDSFGNVFTAIRKEGGGVVRVESIEDVSDFIQKYGNRFPEYLRTNGLKATDGDEAYRRFCSDPKLFSRQGHPRQVRMERRDFDPYNEDTAHFMSASELDNGDEIWGIKFNVECNAGSKTVRVKAEKDGVALDLKFKPNSWSGTVEFRGCKSKISNESKSLWFAAHKDEYLDFQVSLSPGEDFLDFNIFSASSKCLRGHDTRTHVTGLPPKDGKAGPVWLNKLRLKLPLEGQRQRTNERELTLEQEKEEKALISSDEILMKQARRDLIGNPDAVKEAIRIFHQRELAELKKPRVGGVTYWHRIDLLRMNIGYLRSRLNQKEIH
ncbi:MAG: hypothetical protein A2428_09535 [Bdellovibrionales bacterium RIFOXYC1_FULL_54_43]|nr:MAG: hypothetical protein A2428_09535 [Bdellovibrionales bacterium RIFOXYC1_FULL_54_43]OFZ84204.1 MAG: hypothetical protein A2603_14605 [Bdellovibrionales bacterium RIFOXYD1_FULL_55_31]